MHTFLVIALMIAGVLLNDAAWANGRSADRWAAVAVSADPGKDAFGFQYDKDSAAGAENDALRFCEERLRQRGLKGGCIVRSSTEWVIGAYCRFGRSAVGIGATPLEAANDALAQIGESGLCDFKAMRHGSIDKAEIRDRRWFAAIECGGRTGEGVASRGTEQANAAINAINMALKECGRRTANCRVLEFGSARGSAYR